MTRKRTLHDLREKAKRQQSQWWARLMDELLFIYLSGARGINPNFLLEIGYTGRANNPLTAPTSNHVLYGNAATAFTNLNTSDKFDLRLIDRAKTKADAQGGGATGIPVLQPCKIDGAETFVCVMHTFQEDDLRSNTNTGQWLDIQKAAAGADGRNNPMFKGSLGMYRGVILHSHRNVIRFNNAGAGGNIKPPARCSWAPRLLWLPSARRAPTCASTGTRKPATTATRWSSPRPASSASRR